MDPVLTGTPAAPTPGSVPRVFGARRVERLCHATGLLLFLSGLAHLVVFAVDGGPWDGPVSWRKPVTFGVSFGATLIAVTWVTSYLHVGVRSGFAILLVALASGAAMIARGVVLTRTGHQEAAHHSTAPLRPLHGVSLHAVLVLPLLARLPSRTPWSETLKRRVLHTTIGCYVAAVLGTGLWAALTY